MNFVAENIDFLNACSFLISKSFKGKIGWSSIPDFLMNLCHSQTAKPSICMYYMYDSQNSSAQ